MAQRDRLSPHFSRLEQARHLVEIIAFVGAAAWAVYVFVWQERIKPAHAVPRIEFGTSVAHAAVRSGNEFVKVLVRVQNVTDVQAGMQGLIINVYGQKALVRSDPRHEIPANSANSVVEFYRTLNMSKAQLVRAFAGRWEMGFPIPPNGSVSFPVAMVVRKGQFDTMRVQMEAIYTRFDETRTFRFSAHQTSDGDYAFPTFGNGLPGGLDEQSWDEDFAL